VLKDNKAFKGYKDNKESRVLAVLKDNKVFKEYKEYREFKVPLDYRGRVDGLAVLLDQDSMQS
jgi:hypothetical protein